MRTDWTRTIEPEPVSCLKTVFLWSLGSNTKFVSLGKLSFLQVAPSARGRAETSLARTLAARIAASRHMRGRWRHPSL